MQRTHGNGCLTGTRGARNQHRTASDATVLHNSHNHTSSFACSVLPDHALCAIARLEPLVEAEAVCKHMSQRL